MTNTTHYNMTIAEGTDVVNPLTQIFPNFNTIDDAMFANKQSGIGTATEVATGPVHAIVRANPDSNVFRFTATSAWTTGDTMTLDGNAVIVHMSDGTVPATGAYIIGAEVLAMVNASLVTLAISSNGGVTSFNTRTGNVMPEASDYTASDIDFDNTNTTLTSTDVQGAIEEVSASIDSLSNMINVDNISLIDLNSLTWAQVGSGKYYATIRALSDFSARIMISVFLTNFSYLRTTDMIQLYYDAGSQSIKIMSNTNSFLTSATISLRYVYI